MYKLALVAAILFILGTIAWAVFQWRWSNRPHPYVYGGKR
jgi:hypothetical protein